MQQTHLFLVGTGLAFLARAIGPHFNQLSSSTRRHDVTRSFVHDRLALMAPVNGCQNDVDLVEGKGFPSSFALSPLPGRADLAQADP